MLKKGVLFLICLICWAKPSFAAFELKNPFAKTDDTRARDIKYQYEVLKADEKKKMEGKIYNRTPSGYMTVEEYERMSEYKDRSRLESDIPQLEKPS
ncbi:hypothetical protein HDR58_00105, partial [bacterium]|nr:hypothetical protein [bacterium]